MEENSVFFLITRLCENILERAHCKNECSTKTDYLKRLRSVAYGILLKPGEREFSADPHECFLEAITANFQDRINNCGPDFEELDRCVDHLWQKSSTQPFLAPVVYFLSKLHNEGSSVDCDLQQDTFNSDVGASDIWGFSTGSLPKKYHLYHPSLFILPNVENYTARESKSLNYPSIPHVLQNSLAFKPHRSFQLNFPTTNDVSMANNLSNRHNSSYLRSTQDHSEDFSLQLEDEGYVSHGATPLGVSPAELCSTPWDEENFFDLAYEKNTVHLTWEALGVLMSALEPPTMLEAGAKALESQLKIQDCLILTLEPRVWSQPKDPIPWHSLVRQVTYLLIGVDSEYFIFNKELDMFELQPGAWAEGISHDTLAAYSKDFMVMGTCYRRLSTFLGTYGCLEYNGVVQQALRSSTKQYLNFYCGACLLMMQSLMKKTSLSLLLMRSKLRGLNRQIVGLARAFGKWGDGHPIPNDVTALGHLHRHASGTQWKDLACLLLSILNSACHAYFSLLERWVYSGEVIDESDFFVVPRVEYLTCRSRRYWTRAFSVNSTAVPEFMSGLEPFLLRCGKSVNFLKLCDEKNAVLEDAPSCMDVEPKLNVSLKEDQVDSTIPTEETKSLSTELDVFTPDGDLKTNSLQDSQSQAFEVSSEPAKEDDGTSARSLTTIESSEVLSLREDESEKLLLKEQLAQEVIDNRMLAVREDLIQSYAKLSEAADKKRERAEWRIRRMQLRLSDCSSSQKLSYVEPNIDPSPLPSETEANSEAVSNDLIDFSVSRTSLETSPDIPAIANAEEAFGGGGTIDDLLQISHNEHFSTEIETNLDTEEKEKAADETTSSINDETDAKKSEDVIGNSSDTVLPLNTHECDTLESPTFSDIVEESKVSGSPSSDVEKREENVIQESCDTEVKTTEESVTQDIATGSGINTDSPTSDAVSLIPASPSRTPLTRIQGLFSYSHGSLDCSSPDEEITEEEAEHFVWPFKSVLVSLMSHSQKVDAALLKWMLEDQGLVSHLKSLRAYFFLLDGEFGRRLSEDLFSAMQDNPVRKPSILCLNGMTLNSVLTHALASSTYAASDPNAQLLSLTLRKSSGQESGMDQLGCIHMAYEAPWPLNVVLTEEALSKYSRVLDLLLQLKHASWALEDAFLHMRVIDPGKGGRRTAIAGGWKTPLEAVHRSPQYHKLHLYRHQMLNLVRAVQSYITAEVLNASGKNLEEAVATSTSLDEFYAEHVLYVKKILFGCLLNKRSETIYTILKDILKLIMKFHWSLCSRSWFLPPDQDGTDGFNFVHPNFSVLCRIFSAFQEMTEFLLKYAWRLAHHGYQAHLHNLLLMINANNYYNMNSGSDKSGKEGESSVPSG